MSLFDEPHDGIAHVHVDNLHEMHIVKTEEREPEHFSVTTIVIPVKTASAQATSTSDNGYVELVKLDPLRKGMALLTPDGPLILCHSINQATSAANFAAGTPNPEGGYLPQGSNVSIDGTGPLWGVNPGNVSLRVTVIQNRRGRP